ncbi:MAG TPA: 3-hydroxyacyl-CoA dehydrogenase NAD-binding domain-containing protein [Solirubrobacteraceae bacterium]|nr:3-hydroxyacyl-CoA dehydrogenase NAD-binding domain-containing protein [Solirubrobacteraceae bacterium]
MSPATEPAEAAKTAEARKTVEARKTAAAAAEPAKVIGVLGAGTMGAGIAQLACRAGARTLLHDPIPEALQRGAERVRAGLQKEADKGRLSTEEALAAAQRLEVADAIEQLAPCELVIEAAPERAELKRELYERLSQIVGAECVLATNTSSLPVTGIAAAASHPERVVGMHFFNPAPLMRLLEVVAGERSGEPALAIARATGEAMGKDVILASDGPGFLVNRCNRPFGLEALRLLQERIAGVPEIDTICRLGGGFRMGPFELMDLVGVDTGFEISQSFYALSFGEPRWRPSPIAARYVAAGLHGRKSGRGYYDYSGEGPHRPPDPEPPPRSAGARVQGKGPLAEALRTLAATGDRPSGMSTLAATGDRPSGVSAPAAAPPDDVQVDGVDTPEIVVDGLGGSVAGEPFYSLTPLALVEVTGAAGERAFAGLGLHTARVEPCPGGVLGRIVCQLVNECAFALGEGVGSARDIDTGMVLGLNHPRGPLAWADMLGPERVLAVLDALWAEYREERYRAAPALRRLVRASGRFLA